MFVGKNRRAESAVFYPYSDTAKYCSGSTIDTLRSLTVRSLNAYIVEGRMGRRIEGVLRLRLLSVRRRVRLTALGIKSIIWN